MFKHSSVVAYELDLWLEFKKYNVEIHSGQCFIIETVDAHKAPCSDTWGYHYREHILITWHTVKDSNIPLTS